MRIPTRPRESGVNVNITSLIDVIFLLIIFFLAASHFGRTTAQNLPELPEARSGDAVTKNPLSIDVNVFADGTLTLQNAPATLAQVEAAIHDGLIKHGESFGVYLNGEKTADFSHIKPILLAYQNEFLTVIGKRTITGLNFSVLKQ